MIFDGQLKWHQIGVTFTLNEFGFKGLKLHNAGHDQYCSFIPVLYMNEPLPHVELPLEPVWLQQAMPRPIELGLSLPAIFLQVVTPHRCFQSTSLLAVASPPVIL